MKYIKLFEDISDLNCKTPTFTKEICETFSNLISHPDIISIPYNYFKGNSADFHIYFLYGERIENNNHEFLRELYGLHDIINNIYNKEYFHIVLKSGKGIIILFDYKYTVYEGSTYKYSYERKNYLGKIKDHLYYNKIPENIYKLIRECSSGSELISGISTDNGSSNLSLFDWIYEK